jgi:hypothetical protein
MNKFLELLKPIREYLDRESLKPLSGNILRTLGDLRNEEQRRKMLLRPPRRIVKRRLARPPG